MTPQRVMISAPYMLPVVERFRPQFAERGIELVVPPVNERLEEADLLALIGEIDGVICGDDRFTERVLQAAPRLKVIAKWGTGIDSIDQDACKRLGIAVRNTPNAFSEPVADSVLGYMLCFARNLLALDRQMKAGTWHKIPGRALRECTLGVIGVGDVGKAVVRRAIGFGMRIVGNDLLEMPADFAAATGIEMMHKDDLLRQADFVSLNCDLNPTSYHLLSSAEFTLMQPTAVVINTARGPVIDEAALVAALQQGQIAGAGLDVFEDEPLPPNSPLRQMDNVLLAPHNANSSPEAWEHVHQNTIRQLLAVLEQHSS
jgi:D-3-phosphoglycerate dehydrogenase